MYKCESCGHENKSYKDRVIGNFYSGTRQFVKACKKCNWFLFDSNQWFFGWLNGAKPA